MDSWSNCFQDYNLLLLDRNYWSMFFLVSYFPLGLGSLWPLVHMIWRNWSGITSMCNKLVLFGMYVWWLFFRIFFFSSYWTDLVVYLILEIKKTKLHLLFLENIELILFNKIELLVFLSAISYHDCSNCRGTMEGDILVLHSSSMRVHTVVKKAHLGIVTSLMFSHDSRFLYNIVSIII